MSRGDTTTKCQETKLNDMSRDGTTTKRDATKLKQMSEDETKTKYQEATRARNEHETLKITVKRRRFNETE